MSYFDSSSNFFCTSESHPRVDTRLFSEKDPVSFASDLRIQESRKVQADTAVRRKQISADLAREKWGPVSFQNEEAVRFRHKLSEKIIELRRELSQANTVVTFPDHITQEATHFAPPKYGSKWEIFDVKKHADTEAIRELQRKQRLAQERVAYAKTLTNLKSPNPSNANRLSMAWGDILSSDV